MFFLGEVFKQYRRARKGVGGVWRREGGTTARQNGNTRSQALPTSQTQRRVQDRDSRLGRSVKGGKRHGKGGEGVGRPHRPVGSVF